MKIPNDLKTLQPVAVSLARIVSEDSNMFVHRTCGDNFFSPMRDTPLSIVTYIMLTGVGGVFP